jgi:hypothetical protein
MTVGSGESMPAMIPVDPGIRVPCLGHEALGRQASCLGLTR